MKKLFLALVMISAVFFLNGCDGCSQSNPSSPDQTQQK